MDFYASELTALKRAHRYRLRTLTDETLIDVASNDYLGFAHDKTLFTQACQTLSNYDTHAPKASMLVNGYHPLHQAFERALCEANGFEEGIIVGSGFSANIALIEALVRKGDVLLMDENYHASGQLASKLIQGSLHTFAHNDSQALRALLESATAHRIIIAVEGIYSMDGDRVRKEILDMALEFNALIIIDEAHSSGVIGEHLMGVLDFYGIAVAPNHIKMGTLGKAYGSFGAYILASGSIIDYLVNRAKPIIYATAPSLFDTALGLHALEKLQKETASIKHAIAARQERVKSILGQEIAGLIVPIEIGDNAQVMYIQAILKDAGFLVGAIRQPTVARAMIRLIARTNIPLLELQKALELLNRTRNDDFSIK